MGTLIISYHGPEKSGKTTFGFTAPKPMLHLDFDMGRERAIHRFRSVEKDIITVPLPEPPGWVIGSGAATALWANFERIYDQGLRDTGIKSIFIDTGTQMWKANTQEYLENHVKRVNPNRIQLQQMEYRTPNDRMRSKILAARTCGKILMIAHYETDEREERWVPRPDGGVIKETVKTGRKEHAGFGEMRNLTDMHLRVFTKMTHEMNVAGVAQDRLVPYARIETPGWAPLNAVGLEIAEPTYDLLVLMVKTMRGE
jgi:hypothetical protein